MSSSWFSWMNNEHEYTSVCPKDIEFVSHRILVGLPDYKTQKIHADTMVKINTEKKEIKTKLHDQYDENGYKTIAIIVCIIVASAVILCGYLLLQHASKIRKKQATESDYSDRPFVILAGFIFILSSICGCVSICFCATCIGTLCNDCSDMSHSCYEICYTIPKQEREELKEMRNRYYFNAWKRMIKTDQLDYYISYCQKQCKMELSNDICGVIYDYYNVNLNQTHIDMINIHKDNIKTKTDTQKLNIKNQHEQLHLNKKDKNIPVHGISPFIPITNNHILTIQNKITDNTLLNSYKQTCKNISKLTDPIKKFIKRTIYLKYTYIPYQQRKLSSLCIKQYSTPSFEAIEYKKDLELESILSMRGYLNYVNNKTNELIDLLQIIIDNIKSTRNKYQTKITKLELNPRGSKFTLPSLHLNKYRVELSTYEHFVDERITTYIYNLNIQFKRLFKEISRVLIDDNIIQSEIIYTENEWNDLEDIKKYIMGNINKTKDKENIIDFNQIIKIQQNKNDEQKELDIITKWKVNYIENPFFKPQRDDQEKPKYNFNYLQFKQYNIHIKHSIIKKHGNKSDKIYLPKHLKNKNYKRKQYKHQW